MHKSEIMNLNVLIQVYGEGLEQVRSFKHLGAAITKEGTPCMDK